MRKQRFCLVVALFLLCITSLAAGDESAAESLDLFSYGFPGGLSLYSDSYEFSPPLTLTISRAFNFRPGEPTRTCTYQVPACGEGDVVTVCDLKTAVSDHHVLALWPEDGEIVYGGDARHYDGGVFTITSPRKGSLTVGDLCGKKNVECSEEHEALIRLRRTFADLSRQAQSSPQCTDLME
jgi:hypothetical protein